MSGSPNPRLSLDERDALLLRVRRIVRERIVPLEPAFLNGSFRALTPELDAVRTVVRQAGLWAPYIPVADGGMGLALADFAHVSAELGWSPLAHYAFHCQAPDVGNIELLLAHGSAAQRSRWLAPLLTGAIRSCFAMTEPDNAGANPVLMDAQAVLDGDTWVLNAHKWFTTAADGAAFAIVMAVTEPDAPSPYGRASMLLVPMDAPGVHLVRNINVMGHPGDDWASHAELRFEEVRVPADAVIGGRGAGFALAQERLGPGRIHHCMRWIGTAERAIDLMCRRAASRELGDGKRLADQQVVQHAIAESRAELDAARLLVVDTAELMDRQGQKAARERISLIKFHVAGVLQRVLDRAVQVHGALGLTHDTPLAFWYAHERGARIYDGPDEVHKSVVAREILRRYRA
ncbi:MAG: acyl-CoA dehydrogenase family protein [Gemmatimonadaceae bacterium]|nr:acyl-CoA dehydrogenase family protein [Gemmatimonadaceae bacterium]